jgi:ubiquinone/menaquinone biosynthesis C-methylase UbiE
MPANQPQAEAWNGAESAHWVEHADRYDRQLAPFAQALLERVPIEAHHSVLDVGCGCGATTIAAARVSRTALGADLSKPLLKIATDRAHAASIDNVEFLAADAQTHAFVDDTFDLVISQFGVMFFDDPVSAFANVRRALAPGGLVAFVCWQALDANEWVNVIGRAVAHHTALPALGGQAGGPGMFSLQDSNEITALLDASGFAQIEIESISPTILLGGGGTLEEAFEFLLGMGIARGLLSPVDDGARDETTQTIRASLAQRYEPGVGVRLGTGAWLVTARK